MVIVGSKRSQQLRSHLVERFGVDEESVSRGLVALVGAIRSRLPKPVEISLASWVPESWQVVSGSARTSAIASARGAEEIKRRVAEAGIPREDAAAFVVEVVRFLGDRCGAPLAEAIERRIPELSRLSEEAGSFPA